MGSGFRTFAYQEVLTSSNVQNYLMDQAVTVFAGTAARGSAITSPETGMVSYRTDGTADSKREGFEFYDGSAWTRMIPAATSPALVLVKSQTIGSAVSSVAVTSAFSSTYDDYLIMVTGGSASTTIALNLTLGATATGYYAFLIYGQFSSNTVSGLAYNNSTSWGYAGTGSTTSLNSYAIIKGPNLAENTMIHASVTELATTGLGGTLNGFVNNTTQYTDFTLTTSSGTITGGNIYVYGYAK